MKYNIGDEVILAKNPDVELWEPAKVQIIGADAGDGQWLCYVPNYITIKRSFQLNRQHQRCYEFDDKFLKEYGMFINSETPILQHIPGPDGELCDLCGNFHYMAERTNDIFICQSCKLNPWR